MCDGGRIGVVESAAAGGQHMRRLVLEQAGYHAAFAIAELLFAELLEDFRYGITGGFLDLRIGIDKIHAEPVR